MSYQEQSADDGGAARNDDCNAIRIRHFRFVDGRRKRGDMHGSNNYGFSHLCFFVTGYNILRHILCSCKVRVSAGIAYVNEPVQ
jgi:hypothetical protein